MLKVVEHIKEFGLDATLEKFKLKSKMYDHKILIKYDQIDSDMSLIEVQESRGLVLEMDTWKVMSMSFFKFFNAAEGHAAKIDWSTAHVLEKLDGCCDADTILETEHGSKTIKEICDSKYLGKIKGYDHEKMKVVYTDIIGHSVKNNINNWFEIELENEVKIKLTGNHRLYLPELDCYRRVDELIGDEHILLEKLD